MENKLILLSENQSLENAEKFISDWLNKTPHESEVAINKLANNSKYLPISYVENNLDELFFGAWETKDFTYQVVANEIIGSIQLRVFHPIYKIWIERTGCASIQIQMKSRENGGDGDITNVQNKIINTLTKDFPHLKAECIKNAARSLGKAFGRDLNRKEVDNYEPLTDKLEFEEKKIELARKLKNCKNLDELGLLWETLEDNEKDNILIKKLFQQKKLQLKQIA